MFSLGNQIFLSPLVPGGQEPFLESLVTEREIPCSLGQLWGRCTFFFLFLNSLSYQFPLYFSVINIY